MNLNTGFVRYMIVDDSETFREAIKLVLKKYQVYLLVAEAKDGKQALELFDKHQPDLILMDIEMPVLNGIEATKILLKKNKSIKILAISAHPDLLYQNEAMDAGFSGFVYKNDIFEHLHNEIEKLFKSH